jgi:hypothetical protein
MISKKIPENYGLQGEKRPSGGEKEKDHGYKDGQIQQAKH